MKPHQTFQISWCQLECPSFDKLLQVYRVVKVFSRYCSLRALKQSLIWKLFHLLSKAYFFNISSYSYCWKYHKTLQNWKVLNWTVRYPSWEFFYHTSVVAIFSTSITLRPTRGYTITTIHGEKSDNKVKETSAKK